ncbi:H(+)-transporting ATPase, partial [Clostridium saudiense]|nr:H(+)-transporting ATPase [Clostridium saudiense]
MGLINKIKPGRIIVLGFLLVILLGAMLLMLPISINEGASVSFIDALF